MIFKHDYNIVLSMLSQNNNISNKGFLSILQDTAEMHSASIGLGVTDVYKTNFSWALLNWKLKFFSRAKYGETITVSTWISHYTKLFCYRDFEVTNSNGEVIAIATSKWVLLNTLGGRVSKLDEEIVQKYQPEQRSVFDITEVDKLQDPQNYSYSTDYKVKKSEIDVNNHVNNLCYLDIALEVYPESTNTFNSCTELEILYKHQIKIDDKITAYYTCQNGENYVTIKSNEGSVLHSIIKFQ